MQNHDGLQSDGEVEPATSAPATQCDDWANFADNDIWQQQSSIQAEEAEKIPFVADKARAKLYKMF